MRIQSTLALTAALAAALSSPAFARPMLDAAFSGTIVSTYPDGRQAELWLERDGGYVAEGRRHDRSNGAWKLKGSKLCLKQASPFPAPISFCTDVPQTGLDKPWGGKAVTGEAISIRLVKGGRRAS